MPLRPHPLRPLSSPFLATKEAATMASAAPAVLNPLPLPHPIHPKVSRESDGGSGICGSRWRIQRRRRQRLFRWSSTPSPSLSAPKLLSRRRRWHRPSRWQIRQRWRLRRFRRVDLAVLYHLLLYPKLLQRQIRRQRLLPRIRGRRWLLCADPLLFVVVIDFGGKAGGTHAPCIGSIPRQCIEPMLFFFASGDLKGVGS